MALQPLPWVLSWGCAPSLWAWLGCPISACPLTAPAGGGQGKDKSNKWDWVHLVSRSNLARGWDQESAGLWGGGGVGSGEGAPCFPDYPPGKGRAWGCAWALTPPHIARCVAWWVDEWAVVQPLFPSWQSNSQGPERLMRRLPGGRKAS